MFVQKLGDTIGAQVSGVDLSRPLGPREVASIEAALCRYGVLAFRGQQISDTMHGRLARFFGVPAEIGPSTPGADPVVYGIANTDDAGNLLAIDDERLARLAINGYWHVDGCYRAMPHKGAILRALEVPAHGGDTLFANLSAAYAAIPAGRRHRLDSLYCRYSFAHMIGACTNVPVAEHELATLPCARHPLVWRHTNGSRSLMLSPPYMDCIDGLGDDEGQALIAQLLDWSTRQRFLYRHQWQRGDVLMWDNRWTMHRVSPYAQTREKRILRGTALLGCERVTSAADA